MNPKTSHQYTLTKNDPIKNMGKMAFFIVIIATAVSILVPLSPFMPTGGLDPSWAYGMNQAMTQYLSIGKDIQFTLGPYASIYTKVFSPVTDALMIWGSLYLALSFAVLAFILFKDSRWYIKFGLILTLSTTTYSMDAIFFYYPLMLGVYCYRLATDKNRHEPTRKYRNTILAAIFFPLGLLPLIKVSITILCASIIALTFTLFTLRKKWTFAILSVLSPMVAIIFFWVTSWQAIDGLPSYIISLIPLTSGFTEAMMVDGNWRDIIFYIIATAILLWALFKINNKLETKVFLVLIFFISLFVAFKGGFVRHDGHALMAGIFLLLAALLLNTIINSRHATFTLIISTFVFAFISNHYIKEKPETIARTLTSIYLSAWNGLKTRSNEPEKLYADYIAAVEHIHSKEEIPALQGTTDIYSYNQAYLISSENTWNPRPTFQSYSAYTPSLAENNKNHLLGLNAPNNIIFKVEPIDGRLPSLEDGASWPILLSNYEPASLKNDFLYLKKTSVATKNAPPPIKSISSLLGETVTLPISSDAVFSRINISPSPLGKIANILYKPSQLQITLNLENGSSKTFRLISGMTKEGVIISPLIENTSEFLLMYEGTNNLQSKKVKSFSINAVDGKIFWNSKYNIEFYDLDLPDNKQAKHLLDLQSFITLTDSSHAQDTAECDGSIDYVNNSPPTQHGFSSGALLSVSGWLSVSAEKGILPDEVTLVLTDSNGYRSFIKTRQTSRTDVGNYFNKRQLDSSGFTSTADISTLQGRYSLGLAYVHEGKTKICKQFNIQCDCTGSPKIKLEINK